MPCYVLLLPVFRIRDIFFLLSRIREFFQPRIPDLTSYVKRGSSKSNHTFFLLLTVSGVSLEQGCGSGSGFNDFVDADPDPRVRK
jgi:hypothetical protein